MSQPISVQDSVIFQNTSPKHLTCRFWRRIFVPQGKRWIIGRNTSFSCLQHDVFHQKQTHYEQRQQTNLEQGIASNHHSANGNSNHLRGDIVHVETN